MQTKSESWLLRKSKIFCFASRIFGPPINIKAPDIVRQGLSTFFQGQRFQESGVFEINGKEIVQMVPSQENNNERKQKLLF